MSRFRGAGTSVSEGLAHLYYGIKQKVASQRPVVQFGIGGILWFGGNWAYNRVKTPVFDAVTVVVETVPTEVLVPPVFGFAGVSFGPGGALAGAFLGYVIGENVTGEDDEVDSLLGDDKG